MSFKIRGLIVCGFLLLVMLLPSIYKRAPQQASPSIGVHLKPDNYWIEVDLRYDLERDTKMKALFDNAHGQYFDPQKLSQFLKDIERTFWIEVDINEGMLTSDVLSNYDILVLVNLKTQLSSEEIDAIKNFVLDGGALFICGDYHDFFDPAIYNPITEDFGIKWYDVRVYKQLNPAQKDYYPVISTWGNDNISVFLSDNGSYEIKYSGTALNITDNSVSIVGTGDSETYAEDSSGNIVLQGTEIVVFAAKDLESGGRIFASGSTEFLRSDNTEMYLNFDYDNKIFAITVFNWLLKEFVDDVFDIVSSRENITVFAAPDTAFAALKEFLMSANETVYITMYLFTHPKIYEVLYNLTQEKPNIKLLVILQEHHPNGSGDEETRYYADKLVNELGATVKWANETVYEYTHAKYVIIDNKTVFFGTGNFNDKSMPYNNTQGHRDLYMIVRNPQVVQLFLEIFLDDFEIAEPYSSGQTNEGEYGDTGSYIPKFSTQTIETDAKFIPMFAPEGVYYHLKHLIRRAKHFIYLYIPYTTTETPIQELVDELEKAVNRGVTVLAITNDEQTKSDLAGRGINVILTPSDLDLTHAKAIIIDDKIVAVHSSNWSGNGMGMNSDINREAGLGIASIDIATYYRDVFGYDWERVQGSFDSDGDGLCDIYEQDHGLDPSDNDTDDDGFSDWEEVVVYESDPLDPMSPDTAPTVQIITPDNNSVLSTPNIYVRWNASDTDGIDYCEVKLDDDPWINVGSSYEYTFYDVPDGNHTIYVRAYDTSGAYSTARVYVTVSAPPSITLNDPVFGENGRYTIYSAFNSITIGWQADDNSGVDHAEIRIDYGSWMDLGNISCYRVTGLSEGNHTVEIKVVDINGNYNISTINVVVDLTPPTISTSTSRYYIDSSTSEITISWSSTDNVGISYYMVKIGDGQWIYTGTNTSITVECSLPDGIYSIYIKAVDKAGNYNVSCLVLIVDKTPPSISIEHPQNESYISSTMMTVSWNINDNMEAYAKIRVDDEEWIDVGRGTSYQLTLQEGQHIIAVSYTHLTLPTTERV